MKGNRTETKRRKAAAQMWWVIIGAVIALVVLIVLLMMFTEKTGRLETGLSSCESKGGVCVTGTEDSIKCPSNTVIVRAFDCFEGKVCCMGSPKSCKKKEDCGEGESCGSQLDPSLEYCFKS